MNHNRTEVISVSELSMRHYIHGIRCGLYARYYLHQIYPLIPSRYFGVKSNAALHHMITTMT